jgi:hypothetical protein
MSGFLDQALALVARGWHVFPCKDKDKRPLIKAWQKAASTHPDHIRAWAKQWPNALVGISCGQSGLLVVDLDDKNGKQGSGVWIDLCQANGGEPDTYTVKTRSGGFHVYFTGTGKTGVDTLGRGVDTRGAGGYVIAWPDVLDYRDPVPAPEWVLTALATKAPAQSPVDASGLIVAPEDRRALTHAELVAFAADGPPGLRSDAAAVVGGLAWGTKGGRDDALSRLCMGLVTKFPDLDPAGTAFLFLGSCMAVEAEDQAATTVEYVAEKLTQKLAPVAERKARELADKAEYEALLSDYLGSRSGHALDKASAEIKGDSEADKLLRKVTTYAANLALARETSLAAKDFVLGTDQGYFLKGAAGYEGPFTPDLTPARARDTLAHVDALVLGEFKAGAWMPKPANRLLYDYGKVPARVHYVLYGDTRLEADTLLYRAVVVPEIVPEYNPEIAKWLELFSGAQHEPFLDWLATFARFDRPTCAVMAKAMPGVGKGLLNDGLAAMFEGGGGGVSFADAIGPYSGRLVRCPLVIADESLAAGPGVNAVDELKKLVGDSTRAVADKYIKAAPMVGCVRVLLMTNHHGNFRFGRELTVADVAALDQRVLLLEPSPATAGYLTEIGGRARTEAWVQGRGLVRHVSWLARERAVALGSRFLVEGRGGVSDLLSGDSKGTSPVLRAIVTALVRRNEAVRVEDGRVWLNRKRLIEDWSTLNTDQDTPEDLGSVWDLITVPATSRSFREGSQVIRRSEVKGGLVLRAGQKLGLYEEIAELVAKEVSSVSPNTTFVAV